MTAAANSPELTAHAEEILFRRRVVHGADIVEVLELWPNWIRMLGVMRTASQIEFMPADGGDIIAIDVENGWALYRVVAVRDDVHLARLMQWEFREPEAKR